MCCSRNPDLEGLRSSFALELQKLLSALRMLQLFFRQSEAKFVIGVD